MRISNIKILLSALMALVCFMSCSESDEAGEFDNWRNRNAQYIDSIADVAHANTEGDWKIFLADGLDASAHWSNEDYVYCKVLQQGDGDKNPMANDTIIVNYRGRLIPTLNFPQGYVFDQSYYGQLDPSTDVPVKLNLIGCVRGWRTAVAHMVKGTTPTTGDIWRIYVPYKLGYGASASGSIPGYSTLIFDINLVDFYNVGASASE